MVSSLTQRRFAWIVVIFFFAGSVLSYVDRAVLGIVIPHVRRDLSITNTQYSTAINAFLITYMIFYILGGRLADRLGSRRTFTLNIVFWSIASMAHAVSRGIASLCVFRGLLGIGEGGFFPTAMRGAAEWFRSENRAKAVGVLLCGISLGMVVTPPVVAWITIRHGWRAAFLVTGAVGFFLIPPWLLLHRHIKQVYGKSDPAPAFKREHEHAQSHGGLSLRQVLTRRKYWLFLLARAFPDAVTFFYLFWLPPYFQDVRHYDLEKVGKLLWIPFFCADLGALGGAWLSSALIRRGWGLHAGRRAVLFSSAVCPMLGACAFLVGPHTLALALVSLAMLGHFSWSANIQTVVTEITPPDHVAALYGLTGATGTLIAALTQPLIGRSVDRLGYAPSFVGTAVVYALALVMLISAGKIETIK
jgi:ACS family hexuronate transporter-like MFS transporter